jgi:hypothetical protein
MDVGHQKIGRKISDLHGWKARVGHTTLEEITTTQEVVIQIKVEVGAKTKINLCIVCFTRKIQTIGQGTVPSSWSPKKMTEKHNQQPNPSTTKEVNHASHWH